MASLVSDCTNASVPADRHRTRGGGISVVRNPDGTTSVRVAMPVDPNSTYHFVVKCVRSLGDIETDGDGVGKAVFTFQTSSVGNVFAFDVYPEGAPLAPRLGPRDGRRLERGFTT
jgi:hypothetical protein